ncbi:hydrogen gas-evolving membrane-bound hydrogenase subunit E [Shewanella frigidimarina]|uniref:hydrogen gas-evolving membrane-bound hydrogenase subunit E n=1 Tax=Shewanella frigidimarina TaxID=56812 RepID=UPI000F4E9141|nr:hydrogen gas-evolving membrane-bound hydrogenase subunit E [Shewanella frigidimarina]RPA38231.1 sodium:proton antiporter [Shewanella frigidimarina]
MDTRPWLLLPLLLVLGVVLSYAVLSIPDPAQELPTMLTDNMTISGAHNPVSAVLLNFRGYDTLLEMGVLLAALLGVWSLDEMPTYRGSAPDQILDIMSRQLIPVFILVAGYLVWAGADAPGGAFQAGALLGAAGVLLRLCGWRVNNRYSGIPLRVLLVLGLAMFVMVGTGALLIGSAFLRYPPTVASELMLIIESAATLSIGATLAALFLGGRPKGEE